MSGKSAIYHGLESIVAKLYVLKDSCTGVIHTDKSNPNLIWFQGAEAILQEAVDRLQKALQSMETGEAGAQPPTAAAEEEGKATVEEESEESLSEETE